MFTVWDVLLANKVYDLNGSDLRLELLHRRAHELNSRIQVFEVSCKTGAGFTEWTRWLEEKYKEKPTCRLFYPPWVFKTIICEPEWINKRYILNACFIM